MRTSFRIAGSLFLATIFIASIVTDADARRRWRRHFRSAPPVQTEMLGLQRGDGGLCQNILRDIDPGILACSRLIESSRDPKIRFVMTFLRAQGFTAKGDYDSALRDFDDAIRMNDVLRINTNGVIFQGRGWALVNKGEFDRAIADYDEAVKQAPDTAAFLVDRGVAHSKRGNFDLAIHDLDEAIRIEPKLANSYMHRAIAFQKRGAVDRAIRDLDEALRINNKYVQAYNLRGEFYVARGELDRAIRDFDEAIRLDSRNTAAYINRGEAYAKQEQYDRAIKDYNEAIWTDSKSSKAYVGRASAYEKRGDLERARRDYDEALIIDAKDKTALKGRSIVFFKRGDFLRGFDDAKEATKLDRRDLSVPSDYEAALLAGELLKDRKQFNECVEVLTRGIDSILVQQKVNYEIYYQRATCYGESKQFDKAETDLKKALELFPDQPQVLNQLGYTMVERGTELQEGLKLISRAVELKSDDSRIVDSFGWALYKLGQFEDSVRYLRRAADIEPEDAVIQDHLGDAYWKVNRKGEAYRSWERARERVRTVATDKVDLAKIEEKIRYGLAERPAQPSRPDNIAALPGTPPVQPPALPPLPTQPVAVPAVSPPPTQNAALPALPRPAERRVALVIGASSYKNVTPLRNPRKDADAMTIALRTLGFEVTTKMDPTKADLDQTLRAFGRDSTGADWALVYFAGHGVELGGQNYLIPVDAELKVDKDVHYETMPLDYVVNSIGDAKKLRLVVLDACRNNPFLEKMARTIATRAVSRGLNKADYGGTMVAFAAKAGDVALDGDGDGNSPFVSSLIRNMQSPGVELRKLFGRVRDEVMRETKNQQVPHTYGDVGGEDFYFVPPK
jgi:tetratricopeptide (TPR) repeat protein